MKRILVPTDFSDCASNAIDFAVQSARYLPVEITLLHVLEVKENVYTDYLGVNREFNETLLHDAEDRLNRLKKSLQEKSGIGVKTQISISPLTEAVLEAAAENKSDLIIMGTQGAGGLKEKLWGSRTASVIGKTRVPVLAVPFYYTWKKPEKLLFATNHFEKDPAILDYLFEMVDLFMAKVHVVVFTEEEGEKALALLEHTRKTPAFEKTLREKYNQPELTATHLFGEAFEESLQDFIKLNQIDILAMITYPRNFWDRLLHPSITKRMSYHTKIPLLAIPAK
jgi:nucleotide-binding universal stress UspA family protein